MASISSNLIHSDWCELCFSDYKEINPPESNLAEEAQKIKESKNKTENNGDKNIEKININGTKDESKTNPFSASKAETERNYTSECGIIPEGIEINNRMSNKKYTNNGDTIENLKNSSSDKLNYNAETSKFEDDEIGIERLDHNNYNFSQKDINRNIREDSSNNKKDFSNNRGYFSSNTDENPMINNEGIAAINSGNKEIAATNSNKEVDETNSEEKIDETNSKEKIDETNSKEGIAAINSGNEEVDETNPKVNEDFYPETYNNGKE